MTLIELLVVLVVIGILMGVAVPALGRVVGPERNLKEETRSVQGIPQTGADRTKIDSWVEYRQRLGPSQSGFFAVAEVADLVPDDYPV